jgi:hypothetical protein
LPEHTVVKLLLPKVTSKRNQLTKAEMSFLALRGISHNPLADTKVTAYNAADQSEVGTPRGTLLDMLLLSNFIVSI